MLRMWNHSPNQTGKMLSRNLGLIISTIAICCLYSASGARILVIVSSPSYSHNVFYHPIIEELSLRGHQVVYISGDIINNLKLTNLTEIDVRNETYGKWTVGKILFNSQLQISKTTYFLREWCGAIELMSEAILSHKRVIDLLENDHFDLILLEQLAYTVFQHLRNHFKCPLVGISSLGLTLNNYDSMGNPTYPSYYVDFFSPSSHNLTFFERAQNFLYAIEFRYLYDTICLAPQQKIAEKHFGNNVDIHESEKAADLVLVNMNPIFFAAYPTVPGIVQIGGLHTRKRQPLPKDLQQYLDAAKEGVIYFSFGSNVKSTYMPPEKLNAILEALKNLPYKVLWKWEDKNLKNKPDNVNIRNWFPQQDVLDHPNVKGFVTQGGLQSIEEAIRSKVPMVCIPFGGDQEFNARRIQATEIGKYLPFHELTAEKLLGAIKVVVESPLYRSKVHKMSDLLWDQPTKPLDRAIWWIEYVLRHKGAAHLRSPAADMSWFKLLSLDVISFLTGCIIFVLIILIYLMKFTCNLILTKPKKLKTK